MMSEDVDEFPGRLLHQAALWDNAELLEDLLDSEEIEHIGSRDSWGRTPLHAAATTYSSRCLRVLLQSGADPDVPCGPRGEYRTSLHLAAEHGHLENVRLLLDMGADILLKDHGGLTAMDLAERGDHTDCMELLRETADAREREKLERHAALREAVSAGDAARLRALLRQLGKHAAGVINMTPDGCSTLLYKACSEGHRPIVRLLLDHGAEGRIHPVTRYSPLYIAAYNGRRDVVETLLKAFPALVQVLTVERWSPVHACCITGRVAVLEMLFRFPYPPEVMNKYRDPTGQFEYYMPFDINASDMEGQTALYQACCVGSVRLVEALIKFRVKAYKCKEAGASTESAGAEETSEAPPSPAADSREVKRRISDGIQALMSRLNLGRESGNGTKPDDTIAPLHLDMYCNNNAETALHVAVRSRQHAIVALLLAAGANANLNMYLSTDLSTEQEGTDTSMVFTGSTALVEACRNRDLQMIDLLLKHGARDDQCKALYVACRSADEAVVSRLLALRAHVDPDHKVHPRPGGAGPACYVPVMVNWHGQRCLKNLRQSWLTDAAQRINPKLRLVRQPAVALACITRLDVSNNALSELPEAVFGLWSLRYLSAAQNKIEYLRFPADRDPQNTLPVLEELYLQENRLEKVGDFLFGLPRLSHLDLSNNKLQSLPFAMWSSPCLKELNVSLNLLSELPLSGGVAVDTTTLRPVAEVARPKTVPSTARNPQLVSLRAGRKPRSSSEDRTRLRHSVPVTGRAQRHRSQSRQREQVGLAALTPGQLPAPGTDPAAGALHRSQVTLTAALKQREVHHHTVWHGRLEVTDQGPASQLGYQEQACSRLHSLILAHNRFSRLPTGLACLAVSLTRLNLAYNCLTDLGSVSDFPASLKQLDASHNQISQWPEAAHFWLTDGMDVLGELSGQRRCHAAGDTNKYIVSVPGGDAAGPAAQTCVHRRHRRFETLRTLVLADNQLSEVELNEPQPDIDDLAAAARRERARLMFPNLSMLDLSNNRLHAIPPSIHELSNLSVLNISGNQDISELPPQMGLLNRLWNLNTRGCSLQEPLKTMIDSNKYKTMDVIGYLKSVLEDARPYARMKLMIVGVQGIGKTSLLEQLRAEGTGSYKKRPPEHWAKRMGNKNINLKTPAGTTLSTVGVDIGDWIYEKRIRGHSSHGPVTFRTWDFGGQREYYATHQYFLSRRSLYLVVWRIPDGQKGVNNIQQWLVNIQARAPNSPVIIVGTHYDVIRDKYPPNYCEDLQQLIRDRFINLVDADKCGLPRVLDTIEVSCKTRHNIRLLCNLVYDTVYSLKSPGSKERLLEQRIPATYLALEDVITYLAAERHFQGRDPVLTGEQYRALVTREMSARFDLRFRDVAELNQATAFLHENGVVLHYDDATLKDLYFLDPQWLCDMLAHVVTVREINPFARNGVMRLEDLALVFKSSTCAPADAKSYIISLLDKFEVAVTWDSRTLLIPSLLPSEEMLRGGVPGMDVRIPVRSRGRALRKKSQPVPAAKEAGTEAVSPVPAMGDGTETLTDAGLCTVTRRAVPLAAVRRLLLMTYFPSGFWSRLLTRLLADDVIVDVIRAYFLVPRQVQQDAVLSSVLAGPAEWRCWQTGIELKYADTTLIRIRQLLGYLRYSPDYRKMRLLARQEGQWQDVQTSSAAVLEVTLPNETIVIRRSLPEADDPAAFGIQSVVLEPNPECASKLLAVAVDHIDTLLEDWYPTLGTRFVHTSEGRLLVTRLLPCPACLPATSGDGDELETPPPPPPPSPPPPPALPADQVDWLPEVVRQLGAAAAAAAADAAADHSDGDSGVGPDSAASSRNPSAQGAVQPAPEPPPPPEPQPEPPAVHAFLVEECILVSYTSRSVQCPVHGALLLAQVAPDTVFLDVGERRLIRPESVQRGPMLGRGAFGFVFRASYRSRHDGRYMDVAMKMLQPSDPGEEARASAIAAFKAAQNKWDRDPLQYACKAYCTARQELNILVTLRHPYIVPLVGLCTAPLSLVLELAPLGALDTTLAHYRRSGARLPPPAVQGILLQVAKALEYLHQQHIIYRDLKSENVLVWSLPSPFQTQHVPVDVKLADYGISRSTLPAGTKGFAGTEGFMAPEIMRYNGEEEYTEKVDCFSFGMFIYELLTLRPPFEGFESVKEHILEGRRPPLTVREVCTSTYVLDLMVLCWEQRPRSRPSASQIVSMAAAPELTPLRDAVPLEQPLSVLTAAALQLPDGGHQVWVGRSGCVLDVLTTRDRQVTDCHSLLLPQVAAAAAVVGDGVWVGDARGQIRGYCTSSFEELFSYTLEPDSSEPSAVRDICPLPTIDRVAVSLANGRLFITRSDVLPNSPTRGEGSFVMTELGTLGGQLHCVGAVFYSEDSRCELWCGQSGGSVSVFTLEEQVVVSQEVINHYHPPIPNIDVLRLLSPAGSQVAEEVRQSVWTYIHPGCVVYHWDVSTHTIVNKLDCSKLVPVSESMRSISIEEHLNPARCQVTALAVLGAELYLGTSWGCLVVAAADTMLPLTVFRPHEEEVRALVPLLAPPASGEQRAASTEEEPAEQSQPPAAGALLSLGRGYRSLAGRFCSVPSSPQLEMAHRRSMYALVWQPGRWAVD